MLPEVLIQFYNGDKWVFSWNCAEEGALATIKLLFESSECRHATHCDVLGYNTHKWLYSVEKNGKII